MLSIHELTYELITNFTDDFKFEMEDTILFINKENKFVFKIKNKEYIGTKILNLGKNNFIQTHVIIVKYNDRITLFLNGIEMFSIENDTMLISQKNYTIMAHTIPKIIKIIESDLSLWIEKRNSQFKIKTDTTNNYVLVSLPSQEKQLKDIIFSLKDLIDLVNHGKNAHINHILATLRSLLYFKNKNYDPIFFRIAASKNIALPIYVNANYSDSNSNTSFSLVDFATIDPSPSTTKCIDFQEYLTTATIISNHEPISLLNFIGMASTTSSTAHFDQRVPKEIHALGNIPIINNITIYNRMVMDLTMLVINLYKRYFTK